MTVPTKNSGADRKRYQRPVLRQLGDVKALVRGATGSFSDGITAQSGG